MSNAFFEKQSCIWSHTNEDSHKLAALSDCIPGVRGLFWQKIIFITKILCSNYFRGEGGCEVQEHDVDLDKDKCGGGEETGGGDGGKRGAVLSRLFT